MNTGKQTIKPKYRPKVSLGFEVILEKIALKQNNVILTLITNEINLFIYIFVPQSDSGTSLKKLYITV